MQDSIPGAFLDHIGLSPRAPDQDQLWALGEAFARLPYENLSKLIKRARVGPGEDPRRDPAEVLGEHLRLGTGGTCFSLTELFARVLGGLGYRCRPVLCDMKVGPGRHCALVVELEDGPHLLDPGYLLERPLPLVAGEVRARRGAVGEVELEGAADGASFELRTLGVWRYRVQMAPVAPAAFAARWRESFAWNGMHAVHASRALGDGYAYLNGDTLRVRDGSGKRNLSLREGREQALGDWFGIDPAVVREAYALAAAARAGARG